jgi:hypothetical protein
MTFCVSFGTVQYWCCFRNGFLLLLCRKISVMKQCSSDAGLETASYCFVRRYLSALWTHVGTADQHSSFLLLVFSSPLYWWITRDDTPHVAVLVKWFPNSHGMKQYLPFIVPQAGFLYLCLPCYRTVCNGCNPFRNSNTFNLSKVLILLKSDM